MVRELEPKEIVTVQALAISNLPKIEVLRQLLFEKRIIPEDQVGQGSL
jgi:hypothetical protein